MILYRAMEERDRHFVVSAWSQSFRASEDVGFIQDEDYFRIMDDQIDKAMRRPDVVTVVACDPQATDHIADLFGFITVDLEEKPALVYYVYVKRPYRRMGIARGLFRAVNIDPATPFHYVLATEWSRRLRRKIPMARQRILWGRFPKHERRVGR